MCVVVDVLPMSILEFMMKGHTGGSLHVVSVSAFVALTA